MAERILIMQQTRHEAKPKLVNIDEINRLQSGCFMLTVVLHIPDLAV